MSCNGNACVLCKIMLPNCCEAVKFREKTPESIQAVFLTNTVGSIVITQKYH